MTKAASHTRISVRARIRHTLALLLLTAMAAAACSSSTTTVAATETGESAAPTAEAVEVEPATTDAAPTATAVPADEAAPDEETPDEEATDEATEEPVEDAEPSDATGATASDAEPEETDVESASGSSLFGGGDFCAVAAQLDEEDPFSPDSGFEFDVFSEEFFTYVLDLYTNIQAIAPAEIADDIGVVRAGMVEMESIASQYDYNLFDPGMADAMQVFETVDFDTASQNIESYLTNECGLDQGATTSPSLDDDTVDAIEGLGDLEDEDLALLNQLFLSQFNLDPELQACLLANIPDLTQAAADPAILQQEICGTTLFSVFQGLG